jgi:hypothetical protein
MFDGGFKWVRIGQYEDTSDQTGWDWVEQRRGKYEIPPGVDDFVNSLSENGINIELQLLYGNPMYTSPAGILPNSIIPTSSAFHCEDRSLYSIFWPPKTPEQIAAFVKYTKYMVAHFRGRIQYYSRWNEEDAVFWLSPNPEEYGRLLGAFVPAVHDMDPQAKVVYGGQSQVSNDFIRRVLDTCQCAAGIDIVAYHTYPGFGRLNTPPESMDYGAFGDESPKAFRQAVLSYPRIRSGVRFFDDEFNADLRARGNDESVQAKYVPRGMLYNWTFGIPTFIWELINDASSNEGDEWGIIHGMMYQPTDFVPRPVFYAVQHLNWLFSDNTLDPAIEVTGPELLELKHLAGVPFYAYGFRSNTGKAIVPFWLAAHSSPQDVFVPYYASLTLRNTGITHPVLVDIASGSISPLRWKEGTRDTLEHLPIRDSVQAITDESYFDWPLLPEAPSSLTIAVSGGSAKLEWENHGGDLTYTVVECRRGADGSWERVVRLPASMREYTVSYIPAGRPLFYRVRAINDAGESAYSNIVKAGP